MTWESAAASFYVAKNQGSFQIDWNNYPSEGSPLRHEGEKTHILFEYKSHCKKKKLFLDINTPGFGTINSYNKTGKY